MIRRNISSLRRMLCLLLLPAMLLWGQIALAAENGETEAAAYDAQEITELTQVGAGAEQPLYTDLAGADYEEAVIALSELAVLEGYEDGSFRGESILTRGEFTTLVMRLLTPGDTLEAPAAAGRTFIDVPAAHWAYSGIALAVNEALINGYPDGCFYPDEPVSYNQAVKILVCALGYEKQAAQKGPYPYGYLLEAVERGITKSITPRFENSVTRGLAAQLLHNTLELPQKSGHTIRQVKTGIYTTYYLSPDGSDENDGTEEKPWKTLYHAVKQLKAGTMLVLEDGEYFEEHTALLRESGTEHAPIVVKARNKHKAKITYSAKMVCNPKFEIRNASYIQVENIMFRQEARAASTDMTPTRDIVLAWYGGSHGVIRGNHLTNAYEEGLKFHRVTDCVIEDNYVAEMSHEALDAVDCTELIVRNNTFEEVGRVGIMIKGGSSDCQVYNNLVYSKDVSMSISGITVGGSTDPVSTRTPKKDVGYEMYSSQIYNNIVYTPTKQFRWGISAYGAKDCRVFNNVVVGATIASFGVFNSGGLRNSWEWDPPTENLMLYNNIFANSPAVFDFQEEPVNLMSDYNLYSNIPQMPEDPHSITGDPAFLNPNGLDFHLRADSPAIGAGVAIPAEWVGYDKQTRSIVLSDPEGNERQDVWDIGVYQVSK